MRKGIAGLAAGIVGVLSLAALAPTAQAHPCAVAWTLENASFLSANNAAWAAKLPTVEEFSEAECSGERRPCSGRRPPLQRPHRHVEAGGENLAGERIRRALVDQPDF